jgi:hypothetical protein
MLVDVDFLDHWRTRLVVDQLGDEFAPFYILRIWAHCQIRKSVKFDGMTAAGLRSLCRFSGDADRLERALIEAGFIVRNGAAIEVPKWAEHNASLIAAWENGAKGGRPRKPPENPSKTSGKPTGSTRKPTANPNETDKTKETRGEAMGDDGIGTIVKKSMGDGKTKVRRGQDPRRQSSPSPKDARGDSGGRGDTEKVDLTDLDWPRVIAMAERAAKRIPVLSTADRRDLLKHAVIAVKWWTEDWYADSVEAVLKAKETRGTRQGHFKGILHNKALEQFQVDADAMDNMLESIEVPDYIWNDKGVVGIRK